MKQMNWKMNYYKVHGKVNFDEMSSNNFSAKKKYFI